MFFQIDLSSARFNKEVRRVFPADLRKVDIAEAEAIVACGME